MLGPIRLNLLGLVLGLLGLLLRLRSGPIRLDVLVEVAGPN